MRRRRHWTRRRWLVSGACLLAAAACARTALLATARPIVKVDALDGGVLSDLLDDGRLVLDASAEEHVVDDPARWMSLAPGDELAFASLRGEEGATRFVLVVACEPGTDRLAVLPLEEGETPLDALDDPVRRAELSDVRRAGRSEGTLELSLGEALREGRFGAPLPPPRRILAVAANVPSHLLHDLDVPGSAIAKLRATPARVFQKHPPLAAPGPDPRPESPFHGLIGPFDPIVFPSVVSLPHDEEGVTHVVPTCLDYEVELGFVVGRRLTWEDVSGLGDDALWDFVAGYVLVSDVKARNPQVFGGILSRNTIPTEEERRYLTGDPAVDRLIGPWDENVCAWWGYAASQGNYAALGPYFVAANGEPVLQPRAIAAARSYAAEDVRGMQRPPRRRAGELYLRQAARLSTEEERTDRLLWDPPAVLRAILSPRSALDLGPGPRQLERGDVIALGTPGGVVLTVRRSAWIRLLDRILFWWDALDWHHAFFGRDREHYLHEGDEVFLWADGLGCQRLVVRRLELPQMPETVEDEDVPEVRRRAEDVERMMDSAGSPPVDQGGGEQGGGQ